MMQYKAQQPKSAISNNHSLSRIRQNFLAISTLACAATLISTHALAATYTVTHFFGASDPDGSVPLPDLTIGTDGYLYGSTIQEHYSQGGKYGGTVFRIAPSGQDFSVIYEFCPQFNICPLGIHPAISVTAAPDGLIYGVSLDYDPDTDTTTYGATYSMTPTGASTLLHGFDFKNDGYFASAQMILASDGNFYGVTDGLFNSGYPDASGTIFKQSPSGEFTLLHTLDTMNSNRQNKEGAAPEGTLVEGPDGYLYGTCAIGGSNGLGTIFKISKSGQYTLLHTFTSREGQTPAGRLAFDSAGTIYGTTFYGGDSDDGIFYSLSSSGKLTILHQFKRQRTTRKVSGPLNPNGLIKGPGNLFYSTSYAGGAGLSGTVFQIDTSGTVTTLHEFAAADSSGINADGMHPYSTPVIGTDGSLYLTTTYGGIYGLGTLGKVTP